MPDTMTVQTLGQLVALARKNEIKPGEYEGYKYYTLVYEPETGKFVIETTTPEDFKRAKAASPRKGG